MNREIIIKWIHESLKLSPGESMFLPGENREHARMLTKKFKQELKVMAEIDPITSNKLQVSNTIRDQVYWVEIRRTFGNPLLGFKKLSDGSTVRVEMEDPDKRRRLLLMKEDGLSLKEVEVIEGLLTEDERSIFDG